MTASQYRCRFWLFVTLVAALGLVVSCGGGSSGGSSSSGSGELSLGLTDAASDLYQAVYVTIDEVQVHTGGNENVPGNWTSVDMPASPMTVNLLELVNGVREDLGLADLRAGDYTQMRLIIGETPDDSINLLYDAHPYANYVIDNADASHELKVPSGTNTGIKVVKGFEISANRTTELILDFDANRSVVEAGSSGQRLLKPTIAVQDASEYAIIEGFVRSAADDTAIAGAVVSVQVYDAAADTADAVSIAAATLSDATGEYRIFVAPGTYSLVAYADGYDATVTPVTAVTGETQEIDLSLADATTGSIGGEVTLSETADDQYVTLSFRQASGGEMIEVKALNTAEGGYSVDLPEGTFQIVASSYGYTSQVYDITIPAADDQDIALTP